ncbi:glycoside hydrolase family 3 N-terminal domain-containing protein [Streptomyces sp. NPDC094038]|uniref:glycoside hydrolase family 3 N-terminal domain-containing protein n=1 Tax=Streptomyces sp. NPDC094038 TaxID=3366055 RepID=UPI003828323B
MGGRNHAPVGIGERELADVLLPPFERIVAAGVGSVMNSYAEIDGEAPAASRRLPTGVLRERWGFEGTVVSDY